MDMEEMERARLAEWMDSRSRANLPDWDSLPQLELYMDQVIILLTEYLSPLCRSGEEKAVTASIINNYVRMHVMPPPRKKKYGRIHLAYLHPQAEPEHLLHPADAAPGPERGGDAAAV